MWNGLKQMNNLKNDAIPNVNMLKSKRFLYCCFYNRFFALLLGRIQLVGILKETAAGQLHMLFSKMVFCCKESDWKTHVKARAEFLKDFFLETISMIVTAQTNLGCTRVSIVYVWEGQKRQCNCNVSGALVICNILVRKHILQPSKENTPLPATSQSFLVCLPSCKYGALLYQICRKQKCSSASQAQIYCDFIFIIKQILNFCLHLDSLYQYTFSRNLKSFTTWND